MEMATTTPFIDATKTDDQAPETMFAAATDAPNATDATTTDDPNAAPADDEPPFIEPVTSFEEMGLRPELFRGLLAYGFESPSIIQQKAIPAFVQHNRDIIAQAQSGTGKTATFSVALLCHSMRCTLLS